GGVAAREEPLGDRLTPGLTGGQVARRDAETVVGSEGAEVRRSNVGRVSVGVPHAHGIGAVGGDGGQTRCSDGLTSTAGERDRERSGDGGSRQGSSGGDTACADG